MQLSPESKGQGRDKTPAKRASTSGVKVPAQGAYFSRKPVHGAELISTRTLAQKSN